MSHIYVKPLRAVVLDPATRKPLPSYGARVKASTFWTRRLRDKDIVVLEREAFEAGREKARAEATTEAPKAKAPEGKD